MSNSTEKETTRKTEFLIPLQNVYTLLEKLKNPIQNIGSSSISEVGLYGCCVRAALVKSYEFTLLAHSHAIQDHSFFITANLRGICEDLIVLKFLAKLNSNEKNLVIGIRTNRNLFDGIHNQMKFFQEFRPWQPVISPPPELDDESKLKAITNKLGWKGQKPWPSIAYMARKTSLKSLYDYLYSETSKWVHFSPQILMRMGWGGERTTVGNHTEWTFTTSNFQPYYKDFNQIYSLLLFLKMCRFLGKSLFDQQSEEIFGSLDKCLNEPLRWPEAVTFEEMNLKSPGYLSRTIARFTHDHKESNTK